jgi:hypothetical protein
MTAVANDAFAASEWNIQVRDNLQETAPAKALVPGGIFVTEGANTIVERQPKQQDLFLGEFTTSTSYTDLTTLGPRVTVDCGPAAFVILYARITNETAGSVSLMSFEVVGAFTFTVYVAASDLRAIEYTPNVAVHTLHASAVFLVSGFSPQIERKVFTAKYRVTGGTGDFNWRRIAVIPL